MSWCTDALFDGTTGAYWQCLIFQLVMRHSKDLFMGALSVVRKRETEPQFFHDILSSKILVASFIAHEIYQRLIANGAEEAEEMGRVTKLLRETIDDISNGFEEPTIQAEIIPEPEAESLRRLLS